MASSPTPEPPVDSDPPADEAVAGRVARAAPTRRAAPQREDPPRHSPVVLVIDVVRLLRGRGVAIVESTAYTGEALRASADLLRCMGVVPDHFTSRRVEANGPALGAAATLMRAAGIEPNDVVVWPGRQS